MRQTSKELQTSAQGAVRKPSNTRQCVVTSRNLRRITDHSLHLQRKKLSDYFVIGKSFVLLSLRTGRRFLNYRLKIFLTAVSAAPRRRFYFGSLDQFAKQFRRGVALFIPSKISQICSQMRTGTNLKANTQGVLGSTANARNRVISARNLRRITDHSLHLQRKKLSDYFVIGKSFVLLLLPKFYNSCDHKITLHCADKARLFLGHLLSRVDGTLASYRECLAAFSLYTLQIS